MISGATWAGGFGEIINENPISNSSRIVGFAHLESHEPTIIANHGIGGFVAGKVAEVGQALQGTAPIQPKLPEIDVAGTLSILAVALH